MIVERDPVATLVLLRCVRRSFSLSASHERIVGNERSRRSPFERPSYDRLEGSLVRGESQQSVCVSLNNLERKAGHASTLESRSIEARHQDLPPNFPHSRAVQLDHVQQPNFQSTYKCKGKSSTLPTLARSCASVRGFSPRLHYLL